MISTYYLHQGMDAILLWMICSAIVIHRGAAATECFSTTANTYVGDLALTVSGETCQRWDTDDVHPHIYKDPTSFPDLTLKDAENYCRAPDDTARPWCYTTNPEITWEFCDVDQCVFVGATECYLTSSSAYAGRLSRTVTGEKCQRWDSDDVHHIPPSRRNAWNFPDMTVADAENYCRNPDGEVRPWCYTTNPALRWEYCDIVPCVFDTNVYHVTFLGRDHSGNVNDKVGELKFILAGDDPTITAKHSDCTYALESDATVKTAMIEHSVCPDMVPNGNELAEKGIRVESTGDFTLHVYQTDNDGNLGDGYLAIPDEHLGDEYYVVTYCALGGVCQFAITAVEDVTEVSVVFPNPVTQSAACVNGMPIPSSVPDGTAVPYVIDEYETLHFEGYVDFTGVYIRANKKVAVFVGARDVPAAGATPQISNMIEQIIPVNKWGNEFVVIPNYHNVAGDVIVIITKTDNTVVHITGFTPFVIDHAGDSVVRRIDWQVHSWIRTSNPVMILQVMSVDIYNDTNDVTGLPSMVLVPHTDQWTSEDMYFHCENENENNTFTIVTSKTDRDNVTLDITVAIPQDDWLDVEASEYNVFWKASNSMHVSISDASVGGYGYCNGNAAFLLAANWGKDTTDCITTTPVPGDDVDNDCNGQIDEDECTKEDLVTSFTLNQDDTAVGGMSYRMFAVHGINKVHFRLTTCGIGMIQLKTMSEPQSIVTFTISKDNITHVYCEPECTPLVETTKATIPSDCNTSHNYELSWANGKPFLEYDGGTVSATPLGVGVEYTEMILSAFVGSSIFKLDMPEKDCNKVYLGDGEPNSFGALFLIPVFDTDFDFNVVLTNIGNAMATFTVFADSNMTNVQMAPMTSHWFGKANIIASTYAGIKLTVEGGAEVSVYVLREALDGNVTGFSVIPSDVLGPSYHVFQSNVTFPTPVNESKCDLFSLSLNTRVIGFITIPENGSREYLPTAVNTDFSNGKLLQGERPMSVFCGNPPHTYAQMPPRETLGKKYYIPAIDLDGVLATAQINIVAAQDSTIVIIKGDYHQLDSVSLTGEEYYRDLEPSTMYEIDATKPIQVHLEIHGDQWYSVIGIPSVELYRDDFTVYGLDDTNVVFDTLNTGMIFAISDNGLKLDVDFNQRITPITVQLDAKGFGVAFLQSVSDLRYHVLTNQQNYTDINELCVITPGFPGDGIDNDCDGLIDEENCTMSITPGEIDSDLDGSVHEDCSEGTAVSADSNYVYPLNLDFNKIPCEAGGDDRSISTGGTTAVFNGKGAVPPISTSRDYIHPLQVNPSAPVIQFNMPTTTTAPGYTDQLEPDPNNQFFVNTGPGDKNITNGRHSSPGQSIPDTVYMYALKDTKQPNTEQRNYKIAQWPSVFSPEETCMTSCFCPCGWIDTRNYTQYEIQQIVLKLVEKLTVSVPTLSATIRKKISVKDDRPSATTIGWVAVVVLFSMVGTIVILDINSLVRDFKMFSLNIRRVFWR